VILNKANFIIILIGLVLLPLFQNCGMDAANRQAAGLYIGEDSPDCLSSVVDCGPEKEFLQVTIDLSNPSVFAATSNSFIVYGRCNEGNYPSSRMRYRVYDATDLDNYKHEYLRDTGDSRGGYCMNGKYSQVINIPSTGASPYVTNVSYVLKVDILGFDETASNYVHNDETNGSASIDFKKE
jgi:hypothetical protein